LGTDAGSSLVHAAKQRFYFIELFSIFHKMKNSDQ
jgi:hypothetical protein